MPAGLHPFPPIHGDQHCPGGPDPIPCLPVAAYLQLEKTTLEVTADEEALTNGTFFSTNAPTVFEWTTPDNFIKPLQPGRYLCEVFVGIETEDVQWARAPTDQGIVNIGMSYFDPSDPTPNALDQIYVDFAAFAAVSNDQWNLTRVFVADLTEIFSAPDSCFQPLCFVQPDAVAPPTFGNAIAFATLSVTKLGGATTH
jgi:hypothetical protein